MKQPIDVAGFLTARADEDSDFRERLLANPKKTIEELGVLERDDLVAGFGGKHP